MKYKVGDKVERVGTVSDAGTFMMKVIWDNGDYSVFIGDEDVMPLEPPAPVVWRDGAVEPPRIDYGDSGVVTMCKEDGKIIFWSVAEMESLSPKEWYNYWPNVYWLYRIDFPMPALPEPQIAACPFCGGECETLYEDGLSLFNVICSDDCGYKSEWKEIMEVAIATHNELCRKVSHAQD